jgi:hypothetical protein
MFAALHTTAIVIVNLFKSRRRLEAENVWLRHQLNVALRRSPARLRLAGMDRAILAWMVRLLALRQAKLIKPRFLLICQSSVEIL